MNRNNYKEIMMDQLQDEQFNRKIDWNEGRHTISKSRKILKNLTKNEINYESNLVIKKKPTKFNRFSKIIKLTPMKTQRNIRNNKTSIKTTEPLDIKS